MSTPSATQRRERFRGWLQGDRCVFGPNVWDAISARIAEDLGYEMGLLSAHTAEWTINGGEELCRVTLTEFAEMARRITRASGLSLMTTGPLGFGNALSYMRVVEELELAGVACVTIGDQELPLRFGTSGARDYLAAVERGADIDLAPALPIEAAVGMVRAAVAARQDPSLVIGARTNALALGDVADAVRRVRAYADAGAEAVWVTEASREGLEAIHAETAVPLIVGGAISRNYGDADPELAFLVKSGVRIASLGNVPFRAMVWTVHDTMRAQRDGELTYAELQAARVSRDLMTRLTRVAEDRERVKRFLT